MMGNFSFLSKSVALAVLLLTKLSLSVAEI